MKLHQLEFVIKELNRIGKVSRNTCLARGITRLGAIIKVLQKSGYVFDTRPSKTGKTRINGRYVKTRFSEDYVYTLISKPKN